MGYLEFVAVYSAIYLWSMCDGMWWDEFYTREKTECFCPNRVNFTKNEQTGIIKSPQDAQSHKYCENINCAWYIESVKGKGIELRFDWFFTEIEFDYVEIVFHQKDTGVQQSLRKLSGWWDSEELPRFFFRDDGDIELIFHSDYGENYRGFEGKFSRFDLGKAQCECPQVVYEVKAGRATEMRSPGYPNPHCDLMQCFYLLRAEENSDIILTFDEFDMEAYDFLEIYNGNATKTSRRTSLLMAKLSGTLDNHKKKEYRTTTNQMLIRFESDIETSHKGFKAHAKAEKEACKCPEKNFTGESGTILSPGGGKGVYCRNVTCIYNISVPEGSVVQLEFTMLELDTVGRWDYIELFYPNMDTQKDCIVSWRGTHKLTESRKLIYTADMSAVKLYYHADSRSQDHQGFLRGFNLTYTAIKRPKGAVSLKTID